MILEKIDIGEGVIPGHPLEHLAWVGLPSEHLLPSVRVRIGTLGWKNNVIGKTLINCKERGKIIKCRPKR